MKPTHDCRAKISTISRDVLEVEITVIYHNIKYLIFKIHKNLILYNYILMCFYVNKNMLFEKLNKTER